MKVVSIRCPECPLPIRAPCAGLGIVLLTIAGLGTLALLTASALFTVKEDALIFREPPEALGNMQNLADLILTIAGKR